jgi:hypothetical protein
VIINKKDSYNLMEKKDEAMLSTKGIQKIQNLTIDNIKRI